MKVVVATMVKNEDDIVKEWLEYHGSLFGFENLYVIDNLSTDNTFKICEEYVSKGIHLERKGDYLKKGEYMTNYKNKIPCDFFIPLDIDEFIVYYNKEENNISHGNIVSYLKELQSNNSSNVMFKMNYILPIRTNTETTLKRFSHGYVSDYKDAAKTFFQNTENYKTLSIDHGNHMWCKNWILSDLHLIHFHKRSDEQHKKKIVANITGLGYKMDLEELKKKRKDCDGIHHVKMAIYMLENPESSNDPAIVTDILNNSILLQNFTDFF